ncbi:jg9933 [Pararge aegeria aegeria]|uniref:Jg9933 protein n=1 Tax=Pararge aegeria aegeria TaxID=348720 RepID=A0A8S4S517_9NEOP|nr:jg9933 [Pararge aegeria aegeria]
MYRGALVRGACRTLPTPERPVEPYRVLQIGVTSMGPTQCAQAGAAPPAAATSVFTALYPYADLIDATIRDTDSGRVSAAACARRCDALTTLWPIICVLSNFATVNH